MCLRNKEIITARVRSTREGTVFTGVCLSISRGGYLPSGQGGGGTYLPRSGQGVPTFPGGGGGTGGVPTFLALDWGGGVPTFLGEGGTPPLPSVGTPHLG